MAWWLSNQEQWNLYLLPSALLNLRRELSGEVVAPPYWCTASCALFRECGDFATFLMQENSESSLLT
jgi:hypothetical protein